MFWSLISLTYTWFNSFCNGSISLFFYFVTVATVWKWGNARNSACRWSLTRYHLRCGKETQQPKINHDEYNHEAEKMFLSYLCLSAQHWFIYVRCTDILIDMRADTNSLHNNCLEDVQTCIWDPAWHKARSSGLRVGLREGADMGIRGRKWWAWKCQQNPLPSNLMIIDDYV